MSDTVSYTNVHLQYTSDVQGLRQAKADMAAMQRVTNSAKTETQKYEEHIQKLDRLLHNGKITQEQYNQAVAAAQVKFKQTNQEAEKLAKSYAKVTASTQQFVKAYSDLGNAQQRLKAMGGAQAESQSVFPVMPGFMGYAATALVGYEAVNQAKQSVSAYADLEATITTLEVVYGDAAKAAKDFAKFRSMAAVSPLETRDFANAAKIMAQYGVEVDGIVEHLGRISEVAAGSSDRMYSLSLAFGQVKANGRLMGQEVLQMVNAGFNPLAEISRTTGRSVQDLRKDMENGLVTFEMVADAFKSATEDGGRFNGMNEKLATTVNARFAQMRDEITKTREAFGELVASALPLEGIISMLQVTSASAEKMKFDFMNMNAAEASVRIMGAKSLQDVSITDIRTMLGLAGGKAAWNIPKSTDAASKQILGGMIGNAISSIPSQIESAGRSYADALRTASDAMREHSTDIVRNDIKRRAGALEDIKKLEKQLLEIKPMQGDIRTDLPAAVEYGTREAYRVITDAQKMADDAHLKKLEEQRVLQQKQNDILMEIRDKQKVMGIVK